MFAGGRVYFKYREYERQDQGGSISKISRMSERLADFPVYILVSAAVKPCVPNRRVQFTWRIVNLLVATTFTFLPLYIRHVMTNYGAIEAIMQRIARESGLPEP
jgi:hypothetical protein